MPIQVVLTPECIEGICDKCGCPSEVSRLFIEAGDFSGHSPSLCIACADTTHILKASLEDAPKLTGPRPPSRQRRKAVMRQERQTAELIGGRTQKASGVMASAKGDVRLKGILRGEMKSTEKKSFVLKREILDKIRSECMGAERPFVTVRFIHPITLATEDEWVIIPIEHWEHKCHY